MQRYPRHQNTFLRHSLLFPNALDLTMEMHAHRVQSQKLSWTVGKFSFGPGHWLHAELVKVSTTGSHSSFLSSYCIASICLFLSY